MSIYIAPTLTVSLPDIGEVWKMKIHIGEKIRERAQAVRVGPTELARRINTTKQNIGWIYKRASLDSLLLYEISKALELNFFALYDLSTVENPTGDLYRKELEKLKKEYALQQKELESVKEKIELLKENNALLKSIHGSKKESKERPKSK